LLYNNGRKKKGGKVGPGNKSQPSSVLREKKGPCPSSGRKKKKGAQRLKRGKGLSFFVR